MKETRRERGYSSERGEGDASWRRREDTMVD